MTAPRPTSGAAARRDPRPAGADRPDATVAGPQVLESATHRRAIASESLFGGAVEVEIVHLGARYRLRKTALGKLILTK